MEFHEFYYHKYMLPKLIKKHIHHNHFCFVNGFIRVAQSHDKNQYSNVMMIMSSFQHSAKEMYYLVARKTRTGHLHFI